MSSGHVQLVTTCVIYFIGMLVTIVSFLVYDGYMNKEHDDGLFALSALWPFLVMAFALFVVGWPMVKLFRGLGDLFTRLGARLRKRMDGKSSPTKPVLRICELPKEHYREAPPICPTCGRSMPGK